MEKCEYCGGDKEIRNPTGKCDHLYYPENVNKNLKAITKVDKKDFPTPKTLKKRYLIEDYLAFKQECINQDIINVDEIIKLFEVWLNLLD